MPILAQFARDLHFAFRQLRKSPGFAFTAILTLALGIGANTAIFSVMHAVLLRMLPVRDPDQLFYITHERTPDNLPISITGDSRYSNSINLYNRLREDRAVLSDVIAYVPLSFGKTAVRIGENPEELRADEVSGNFFSALGVSMSAGSAFTPDDETKHSSVAVLSYGYWNARFSADPAIIGRTISVRGIPFTILGVAAPHFYGVESGGSATDLWIPLQNRPELPAWGIPVSTGTHHLRHTKLVGSSAHGSPQARSHRGTGRRPSQFHLRPCVLRVLHAARQCSAASVAACCRARSRHLQHRLRNSSSRIDGHGRSRSRHCLRQHRHAPCCTQFQPRTRIRPAPRTWREPLAPPAPIAGRKPSARHHRLCARLALRRSKRRTCSPDGPSSKSASLPIAPFSLSPSRSLQPPRLLFGLAPLRTALSVPVGLTLKASSGTQATASRHRALSGKILIAIQMAFCCVLLFASGLLVRTLLNYRNTNLGIQSDSVLAFGAHPLGSPTRETKLAFYRELLARLQVLPGVKSAAVVELRPGTGWSDNTLALPRRPPVPLGQRTQPAPQQLSLSQLLLDARHPAPRGP